MSSRSRHRAAEPEVVAASDNYALMRDPALPGWVVTLHFGEHGEITSLSLDADTLDKHAQPDHAGVTTTLLRRIRLANLERIARAAIPSRRAEWQRAANLAAAVTSTRPDDELSKALGVARARLARIDAIERPQRPGRAGNGDLYYAQLAAEYVALLDARDASPVATMLKRRGAGWSRQRIADQLTKARERELLTRPGQGRARGQLTDKAIDILRGK